MSLNVTFTRTNTTTSSSRTDGDTKQKVVFVHNCNNIYYFPQTLILKWMTVMWRDKSSKNWERTFEVKVSTFFSSLFNKTAYLLHYNSEIYLLYYVCYVLLVGWYFFLRVLSCNTHCRCLSVYINNFSFFCLCFSKIKLLLVSFLFRLGLWLCVHAWIERKRLKLAHQKFNIKLPFTA